MPLLLLPLMATKIAPGITCRESLVTCGIYMFYWMYKQGEKLDSAKSARGLESSGNSGIIYLVLTLFGLGIVSYALMQNDLNKLA